MTSRFSYRPEIDGLRALAVLPVIFFHAGFKDFSGGYVGVDVFFVISGYLITSLITQDLAAGTFSFRHFYERRARRILPALYFMLLCTLPFSYAWMMPHELKDFGDSLVSVCLFVSNLFFWTKSGYFENISALEPLLHTWSLAIEEQFYIFFPLVMVVLWHFAKGWITLLLGFLALASFILCLALIDPYPSFTFFWLPTRIWELLAGALVSFLVVSPQLWRDHLLGLMGLALILVPVFTLDEMTPYPSLYTLAPVLGTCLILSFARTSTVVGRLLSLPPLVGMGLISYSAYLWHQPLFAFARLRLVLPPSSGIMLGLCCITIVIALISYWLVERPWRSGRTGFFKNFLSFAVISSGVFFVLLSSGIGDGLSQGWPQRLPPAVVALADGAGDVSSYSKDCLDGTDPNLTDPLGPCHLGVPGQKPDFILFGDSYSGGLAEGLSAAAAAHGRAGLVFALRACFPITPLKDRPGAVSPECLAFQDRILDTVKYYGVKSVIFYAHWKRLDKKIVYQEYDPQATNGVEALLPALTSELTALKQQGVTVHIVCCTPNLDVPQPQSYARINLLKLSLDLSVKTQDYLAQNRTAFALFRASPIAQLATLTDITGFFCGPEICDLMRNGRPVFFDTGHLSRNGSRELAPYLEKIFVP